MAVKKLIGSVEYHVVIFCVLLLTHPHCEALPFGEVEKRISRCSRLLCYEGRLSIIDENGRSDNTEKFSYGLQKLIYEIDSEEDRKELFCCFKEIDDGSNNYDNNMGVDSIYYLFTECGLNVPSNPYDLSRCYSEN